ncbi:hypothetical protein [Ralstonia sp. SET104]|uniref:hypothetical protein n=1 Tax=Ralstonia sp. SET104 TaxID=2448774 RepID=UPI000F55EBA5|nr:hypothetical protein [Ralstonia sp. SET104]
MKQPIMACLCALANQLTAAQSELGVVELKTSSNRLFSIQTQVPGLEMSIITTEGAYHCCCDVGGQDRQDVGRMRSISPEDSPAVTTD